MSSSIHAHACAFIAGDSCKSWNVRIFSDYLRLLLPLDDLPDDRLDDRVDDLPDDRPEEDLLLPLLLLLRLRVSQPFFAAALRLDVDWLEPPLRPPLREEE